MSPGDYVDVIILLTEIVFKCRIIKHTEQHNLPFYILGVISRKGGSVMRDTLNDALAYLGKAAAVLAVIAEAGKKIMALCEE